MYGVCRYQVVALDYSETMQFAWLDIGRPKTAKVMKLASQCLSDTTNYLLFFLELLSMVS